MKKTNKSGLLLCALFVSATADAAWDGVLDWARRTEMSTPASGIVAKVLVRAGERVKENTVLLQLGQTAQRARVEQGKAEVQHATLLREEAERELSRAQELYDRTLLADHDLNLAKLAFAEADAAFLRARANLQEAEESLSDSEIHAPFDAVILDRRVQPAQTIMNQWHAEPMLVIAAAKEMLVRFVVQNDEIVELIPGKAVNVECQGQHYQGIVESLRLDTDSSVGSSSTVGYTVEVLFATDKVLFPGTKASVSLP